VFYIQEPSRGNQNINHWRVVEHVNHRKIWDLPLIDGRVDNAQNFDERVENIDHNVPEDLDVVHNKSSSGINLFIDFSQYFTSSSATQAAPAEVFVDEPDEVSTGEIDEVSGGEIDEVSGDEFDYYTEGSKSDTEISEGEISMGSD
jgi:hypothetical protein